MLVFLLRILDPEDEDTDDTVPSVYGLKQAINKLNETDIINIALPTSTSVYWVDVKISKVLRSKLFKHMKGRVSTNALQAKDLYNLEKLHPDGASSSSDASSPGNRFGTIDKDIVTQVMKDFLLMMIADVTKATLAEKHFIDFRNNWLKLEAQGSIDLNNTGFEPFAFKTLAAAIDHVNHGTIHKLYNYLEADKKVFENTMMAVEDAKEIETELKKLQTNIIEFVKKNLIIVLPDVWTYNTDFSFNIQIGKTTPKQDVLVTINPNTFDINKKEDFDRIKDFITPISYGTSSSPAVNEDEIKLMAMHGLLILNGGRFRYNLNPDKITEINDIEKNFTDEEKKTLEYKIYAARLKEIEIGIQTRLLNMSPTLATTIVDGSLLDAFTQTVRITGPAGADNKPGFNQAVGANLLALGSMNTQALGNSTDVADRTIQKIGFVGNKWLVLISSRIGTNQNLIGFLTEPGVYPRFLTAITRLYSGKILNQVGNIFPQLTTGIESRQDMFQGTVIDSIYTKSVGFTSNTVIDGLFAPQQFRFRIRVPHGFANRAGGGDLPNNHGALIALRSFNRCFISDLLGFGTTTHPELLRTFEELNKFDQTIAQLYVYNQFTYKVHLNGNKIYYMANNAFYAFQVGAENARHLLTTHVINLDPNDATFLFTGLFYQ